MTGETRTGDGFVDAVGVVHPNAGANARIVSLVPSITETLIEMGLADQLVGRTRYCIHPAEIIEKIPIVGGTKQADIDNLKALAPSHVFFNIDANTKTMVEDIATFVPHCVVTHPNAPEDNQALFDLIGGIFGAHEAAARLRGLLDDALDRLHTQAAKLPARKVVYFIWREPWKTISRDTYISAMLARVNWATQGHDPETRYPEVLLTPEIIAETDLFLFSTEPFAFTQDHIEGFVAETGAPAEKCRLIDGEYCSWYGSRAIAGIDYLGNFAAGLV